MKDVKTILSQLEKNFSKDKYKGMDLFDGLNSLIYKKIPFNHNRYLRLAWIQFFKKSPINLRKLFRVPSSRNPKGISLIMRGYLNLHKLDQNNCFIEKVEELANILLSIQSKRPYSCWGYDFLWEARAFSVPAYKPNMIVSSFVAQSFLDYYDLTEKTKWLQIGIDVGEFIKRELVIYEDDSKLCFGYIPSETTRVHNANLMGARLFARLFFLTKNNDYFALAKKSIKYSVKAQRDDGAWVYGENDHHQWVDNFHTGYNLDSLYDYQKFTGDDTFKQPMKKGLQYYLANHFNKILVPKAFDNRLYPIDIHNFSQGILTFDKFELFDKADQLVSMAIDRMYDRKKGYFYYQKHLLYTNTINYFRWSQGWMFYALSSYLYKREKGL